jgi:hypothetical protein
MIAGAYTSSEAGNSQIPSIPKSNVRNDLALHLNLVMTKNHNELISK